MGILLALFFLSLIFVAMRKPSTAICIGMLFLLLLLHEENAHAYTFGNVHWKRAVLVDEVAPVVVDMTKQQMRRKLVEHGHKPRGPALYGLAVLMRNSEGQFHCYIYIQERTHIYDEVLEHEKRHCRGWVHR